jgi:hypothetical protein
MLHLIIAYCIRYHLPITLKDAVLTKTLIGKDGEAALLYEGGHLNTGIYYTYYDNIRMRKHCF